MDMKKLLTIISGQDKKQINESAIAECGDMQPNMPPATPPVTMNMSLNAQGVDQIKELLNLMSQADASRMSGPMSMPAAGMDMPIKLGAPEVGPKEPDMKSLIKIAGTPEKEDFANRPDPTIGDLDDAIPAGDDLHKKKGTYPKVAGGDNPMQKTESQLKSTLYKLYQEIKESKKSKPDFLDVDKDGNKKEPMKKAVKDKEVDEGFDADSKVGDTFKTAKGTATKTKTGVVHKREKYDYDPGSDDKDDKKAKAKAKAKK